MFNDQDNHSEEESFLPGHSKRNPFIVPEGYFEKLADTIIAKIEIEEELNEFALLASLKHKPTFEAPADYFKTSENALEYRYELSAFETLANIPKPVLKTREQEAGYADALDAKVLQKIGLAEELEEYSLLSAMEKQNNYAVTPDYFDTVADKVKERYYAEQKQNVPLLNRVLRFLLKPRVALAYSLVFLLGIGLLYYKHSGTEAILPPDGDCKTLACLEKREMLNEHTVNDLSDDNLYEMVDVDALDKQLASDTTSAAAVDSVAVQHSADSSRNIKN